MRLRESVWALLSRFLCLMQSQQGFFQPSKELCCKRVSTYRLVRAKWVRTDNGSTRRAVGVGEGGVRVGGGQGGVSSILTITFTLNLQFFEVKKPFRYEMEALHFKTLVRSSGEGDPRSWWTHPQASCSAAAPSRRHRWYFYRGK